MIDLSLANLEGEKVRYLYMNLKLKAKDDGLKIILPKNLDKEEKNANH